MTTKQTGLETAVASLPEARAMQPQLAPIAEVRAQLENRQHRQLVKDSLCPNATDLEFEHIMATAWHLGLDPILQQIYFFPVYDSRLRRESWVPVVSIGGLLSIADRTGEYQGRTLPQWCGQDAQWVDVWLADTPPGAAKVGVHRANFVEPLYGIVTYREYCRRRKDGKPMAQWGAMPAHMLFKCALSQALRTAFPREMAGDYGVKDVSMPGEPGRFRIRDTTDEVAEQVEPKQNDDDVGWLLGQIQTAQSQTKLDALARKASEAPEASRAELRRAWVEAKTRIEAERTEALTEKSGEHHYGPAPMTDAEVAAVESGEQAGFGFDSDDPK